MTTKLGRYVILAVVFLTTTALLAEQEAILKVNAEPKSAIVFVDGKAYKQHNGILEINPGEHKIGVYRYGFQPFNESVTLKAGENPAIDAKLESLGGKVDGPWGNLEIQGVKGDYLVFLNGRTPDFCIGFVDEVKGNHLLLPPGQQHVYIVRPDGNQDVNTWYVNIVANQKAIFHADRNQITYEKLPGGEPMHSLPRYQADNGILAVGPVGLKLFPGNIVTVGPVMLTPTAFHIQAKCGVVQWQVINGYQVLVKQNGQAVGSGGATGQQAFDPKQAGAYFFETFGPGGVSMTPVTIDVKSEVVKTDLQATPATVLYHKVGDKVLEPGTATLKWSAENAKAIQLEPIDPVTKQPLGPPRMLAGSGGEETIKFSPSTNDVGPVNQTLAYRITATNDCNGSDSSTTLVQVAGSIDPPEPPIVAENLPPVLPQTGSELPLIGLVGMICLVLSFALGWWRNRRSVNSR